MVEKRLAVYIVSTRYGLVGHSRSCSHDSVHRIFSLVDREARKALKRWMREVEGDSIKSHTYITKKKGTPL
jgi:hypothetical protein